MISTLLRRLTLIALAMLSSIASAEPFPPADGLEPREFKEVRVKFRGPKDWVQDSKKTDSTVAFFMSKQALVEGAAFQSGISLNVVTFPQSTPEEPLNYAKTFAISYPEKFGEGAECGWKAGTPLSLFWCQANIEDGDQKTTALHHLIANSSTGKLYIFMFETRQQDWQQSWPTITTMLKSIEVDPTN